MTDEDRSGRPNRFAAPKNRITETPIRSACPADADTVVAILAQAFQDDPVTAWVFPDARRRRALLPSFFHAVVDDLLAHGEIYLDGEAGVTLFVPPHSQDAAPDRQRRHEERLRAETGECADRAVLISRLLEEHHPCGQDHYYVVFNAVHPDQQNRGVGSGILRRILARADAAGSGAYVECSTPRSLKLMARHRFTAWPLVALPDGPVLRPAWRDPHPDRRSAQPGSTAQQSQPARLDT